MSSIQFYLDEDAEQRALVKGLRERGLDVLTAWEAGMVGRTDDEQLQYAVAHERVLYSLNVGDFAKLHKEYLAAGRKHYGIVVIPSQRYDVGEKIRRLAELADFRSAEEMRNRIEFL